MEAFIRERGVTVCPPVARDDRSPARALRDDARLDWLRKSAETQSTPKTRLACAKLFIMLRNLAGQPVEINGSRKVWIPHVRDEAHRWFFGKSDFELWCEDAGLEPDYVREKARKVYENGLPASAMNQRRTGRCSAVGCKNPDSAKGLCMNHYMQERYGVTPVHRER